MKTVREKLDSLQNPQERDRLAVAREPKRRVEMWSHDESSCRAAGSSGERLETERAVRTPAAACPTEQQLKTTLPLPPAVRRHYEGPPGSPGSIGSNVATIRTTVLRP
jgi:hypothetical protein